MARFGAIVMLLLTGVLALGLGVCAVGGVVGSIATRDLASVALPISLVGGALAYGFYRLARFFGGAAFGPDRDDRRP